MWKANEWGVVLMFIVALFFWSKAGEAIQSNTVTVGGRWIWLLNFRKQRGIAQKCKQKTSEKRAQARGKEESSVYLGISLLTMAFLQVIEELKKFSG